MARRGTRGKRTLPKRNTSNTDHPLFTRYRKMLTGLEVLDKKGEEARRKAQERRRQTLG
jgi:hypothetical protein